MGQTHVVVQGEHISGIAAKYGFVHYRKIWDHPQNAELKALRENPNVLFPGDKVFIPDFEIKKENRSTDQLHPFKMPGEPLLLRLVLERLYSDPYANTPCVLVMGANRQDLTADGKGKVEQKISKSLVDAGLIVKDHIVHNGASIPVDREIQVKVGHLDPVKERSGQQARLANLGYYRGPAEGTDEDEFLSAVEEFQCEHKLLVDGKCGPVTQSKLIQVHGC
ncbi:MAG TPA: peptidoglycan-binding protein [Bryobacteraceae bacterium]|nr:peptidoglycan-binding protein [Bryobacteraceae bacterium]